VILKNGQKVDNIPAIKKAIEGALTDFRAKTGQKTGSIDPRAFRQYVEATSSPTERDALKYMNRLRNLFNEILPKDQTESKKGMGLTPFEAKISRTVLLESLGVEGIEPEKLEEAILTDTSRPGVVRVQPRPVMNPQAKPVVNPAK
jgi:hypothetical protein